MAADPAAPGAGGTAAPGAGGTSNPGAGGSLQWRRGQRQCRAERACDGKTRKMTIGDMFIADFESGDMHGWYDYTSTGALNKLIAAGPGAASTVKADTLQRAGS